ncbi:MAG TPA: glyceraldehyde-3-phosphate dehydrogenase [Candidatus Sphingobacterium stercoripullorum]|uniref:Glyceraldehyde-3-phosphate dehydrogenase n=1 Tax=Candidatus Sphingobacterium stercoripullorum TaxID=2838759 RepID=A0A9D1W7X3_9SPHI|nr:glyceraldehyde-3-phosphate dehydrogenase [Candidatus Sphingobacterium stercoripullorum]
MIKNEHLSDPNQPSYLEKQQAAMEFIDLVNKLWLETGVELVLFRQQLVDRRVSVILNLHHSSSHYLNRELTIFDTLPLVRLLEEVYLPAARVDLGKLLIEALDEGDGSLDNLELKDFLVRKLCHAHKWPEINPRDVVLFGFGRIGRLLARELIGKEGAGRQLRLKAIVTRDEVNYKNLQKRASLLEFDSIHGDFEGTVLIDEDQGALIINGVKVYVLQGNHPSEVDYQSKGINNAVLVDNTGAFRDHESLSFHLKAKGISEVILTAPGKGVPNIVYGVNHEEYSPKEGHVFSAASCTTNAIVPILKVVQEELGIEKGHIETIHAYTNDQNLVDNMHKKHRRGRAAALNMVITETGAGSAVAKVIPELDGKLTSNAIRVPVPNGSLAILNLSLKKQVDVASINAILKNSALYGDLVEQIKYSVQQELVSSDIVGTTASSVVDSAATVVSEDGKQVNLYIWYDNEYGYMHQVMRLLKHVAQVRRFVYY